VKKFVMVSSLAAHEGNMSETTQAVARVTDTLSELPAASPEQSGGIEQVSWAITQMDEVTQQYVARGEEVVAAS
jgi:methyl-accepting chemotaxis protein